MHWKETIEKELRSLTKNQTWKLVEIPDGVKAKGNKRIFRFMKNGNGETIKVKTRLVGKGFMQKERYDFNERTIL